MSWLARLDFGRATILAIAAFMLSGAWIPSITSTTHVVLATIGVAYFIAGAWLILRRERPSQSRAVGWVMLGGACLLVSLIAVAWPFWITLGLGAWWQPVRESHADK